MQEYVMAEVKVIYVGLDPGELLEAMRKVFDEEKEKGLRPSWSDLVRRALVSFYLEERTLKERTLEHEPERLQE